MIPRTGIPATFERRILVNYRIDPDVAARVVPRPFTPDLVDGFAVGGLCIVQLRLRRPMPQLPVVSVAHRFAVTVPDGTPAVYVPRRDTSSAIASLAGGRLVPGVQQRAHITSRTDGSRTSVEIRSHDERMRVDLDAEVAARHPRSSVFADVEQASTMLRCAPVGYSRSRRPDRFDAVELCSDDWQLAPLAVERLASSYFDDERIFPASSIGFDSAFVMTDVAHRWRPLPTLEGSALGI
jgi:hypothetical protein